MIDYASKRYLLVGNDKNWGWEILFYHVFELDIDRKVKMAHTFWTKIYNSDHSACSML